MDYHELDAEIKRLEDGTPPRPTLLDGHREWFDWKSLFALAREVQAGFDSGVRYPTAEERQRAWERFNEARSELHESNGADWKHRKAHSKSWRHEITKLLDSAVLPGGVNTMLGLVSGTTLIMGGLNAEDMKWKGEKLREAKHQFSRRAPEMIREHKEEIYALIGEIQNEHDVWWRGYKRASEESYQERQDNRRERLAKARVNLEANLRRYEKAANALGHVKRQIVENEEKRATATSDKWRGIFEAWIEEGERTARDIERNMEEIQSWVEQDRERIEHLRSKL